MILESEAEEFFKEELKELYNREENSEDIYRLLDTYKSFFLPMIGYYDEEVSKLIKNVLEKKLNRKGMKDIYSLSNIYEFVINLWGDHFPCKKKLKDALIFLSLSQKGLTEEEIIFETKLSEK